MKKIILFLIVVLLVVGGFILIKAKKDEIKNEPKAFIHTYKPLEEKEEIKNSFETFSAKLEAIQTVNISTKILGYIKTINIKENQEIKKGDILLKIDDSEYKYNISQLKYSIKALTLLIDSLVLSLNSLNLDMQLYKQEYDSNKKLYKIGGVAKNKLDLSQILYEQKKANYSSTKKNIESKNNELNSLEEKLKLLESLKEYYLLKSPINGYVQELFLEAGDLVNIGKTILSLISKEQKLSFLFANNSVKKNQEVYIADKKIGFIQSISISAKNYLKEANIKLDEPLSYPINSLIPIKVKTDD